MDDNLIEISNQLKLYSKKKYELTKKIQALEEEDKELEREFFKLKQTKDKLLKKENIDYINTCYTITNKNYSIKEIIKVTSIKDIHTLNVIRFDVPKNIQPLDCLTSQEDCNLYIEGFVEDYFYLSFETLSISDMKDNWSKGRYRNMDVEKISLDSFNNLLKNYLNYTSQLLTLNLIKAP